VPAWALDAPSLRPPLPPQVSGGAGLESLLREAVRARLEGRKPHADAEASRRAQQALRAGGRDAAFGALYLREVGVTPEFRFAPAQGLRQQLTAELEVDDATGQIDPRICGALLALRLPRNAAEAFGEARRRLAAAQLFTALLEAGFFPDNNWEEAVDSADAALELLERAGGREVAGEAFRTFATLPEEARLRRLAYLAESAAHLEALSRMPEAEEPDWRIAPEWRECHEREMELVETLGANDIPAKVPKLAKEELGVPEGQVPEESEDDLFLHLRCPSCGKEKLLLQSAEA
jgi:hypothetical protein